MQANEFRFVWLVRKGRKREKRIRFWIFFKIFFNAKVEFLT